MKFIVLLMSFFFVLSTPAIGQQRISAFGDSPDAETMPCPELPCPNPAATQLISVSTELGTAIHDAFYKIEPVPSGFRAQNRAQKLNAEFAGASTRVTTEDGTLELRLLDYGSPKDAKADGLRLQRNYRGLHEYFVNDTAGLEQQFVVEEKPANLLIRLAVSGGWKVSGQKETLSFTRGKSELEYSALKVWDARGTRLPAEMRSAGNVIEIKVNDAQAVYPVTVDPLFNQPLVQAVLTDSGAALFGYSVSISADGNTALVGAISTTVGGNVQQGSAYVFVRNGGSWFEQAILTAPSSGRSAGAANDGFGQSVSLSANGNIALIGAANKLIGEIRPGAAYIFNRSSGPTWSQSAFIEGSEDLEGFGVSVALSADGTTAIIGATGNNTADIYTGPVLTSIGYIWAREAILNSTTEDEGSNFGAAVALSGDGSVALVGAFSDDRAYIFTRSAGWAVQQILTPPDTNVRLGFGASVSLTPAGTTALVGADQENDFVGAAYVFTSNGASWTQQARLSAPGSGPGAAGALDAFGLSVNLSPDGTSALVGAPSKTVGSNAQQGAAYMFTRNGNSWPVAHFLTAPSSGPNAGASRDFFGSSVALSGGGQTAIIGGYGKTIGTNADQGAAYVIIPSPLAVVVGALTSLISSFNLPAPAQSALLNTVQRLTLLSGSQNAPAAIESLHFFIGRVQQQQSLNLITAPQADQLIGVANQAIADLVTP